MTDFKQRVKDFCDESGRELMYEDICLSEPVKSSDFKDKQGKINWLAYNAAVASAEKEFLSKRGFSSIEEVDRYGGEGMGSDFWAIIKFTDKDSGDVLYVKCYGWYQSHYGSEYEGYLFVQPKQVMVTKWS